MKKCHMKNKFWSISLLFLLALSLFTMTFSSASTVSSFSREEQKEKLTQFLDAKFNNFDAYFRAQSSTKFGDYLSENFFAIKNESLRDFFYQYALLNKQTLELNDLGIEMSKRSDQVQFEEKNDVLLVKLVRTCEIRSIIDGVRQEDPGMTDQKYEFTFDKEFNLIGYKPYDKEEMVLMESDLSEVMKKEKQRIESENEQYQKMKEKESHLMDITQKICWFLYFVFQ